MFYDKAGRPAFRGKTVREFVFDPAGQSALPWWLVANGTSPILTYGTLGDRGALRMQTKSATPTSGDQAGVSTVSIDPTRWAEVGFFVSGLICDATSLVDQTVGMGWNNASTQGFYHHHDNATSETRLRVYPAAAIGIAAGIRWQFITDYNTPAGPANGARSKDIGFVMRNTGEIFITAGDPYDGAGVVAYSQGVYPTSAQPINFYGITRTAGQRYTELTRVKLLLVQA